MSLDDFLGFVVEPLRLTQSRVIGRLGRLQGGPGTVYPRLSAAKLSRLVLKLSGPQRLAGGALL